jgi:hypothetical protein
MRALLVGCVVVFSALAIACGGSGNSGSSATEPATIPRKEFVERIMGMSKEDVIKTIGKPGNTMASANSAEETWFYKRVTHDEVTGSVDLTTSVFFTNGKVDDIRF